MKFKNKKSGEIYKNYLFCGQYDGYCPNCPIYPNLGNFTGGRPTDYCDEWISAHLNEAAELMGYEVIDEGDTFEPTRHREVTRKSILQKAERCVCGDRDQQYGGPEHGFHMIAALWELYLKEKCVSRNADVSINPEDVPVMMALFKIARIATGSFKEDSYIDACGYLACGGELEGRSRSED